LSTNKLNEKKIAEFSPLKKQSIGNNKMNGNISQNPKSPLKSKSKLIGT